MADYDLGTARGRIEIDASGAEVGADKGKRAIAGFTSSMDQASSSLIRTGGILGGIGAATVAGFGLAIKSAADFEKRISAIGAVSNTSGKELDSLRQLALQLGKDTKFSAGEAAVAIEELAKAGIPVKDILNGAASAVTNLAAAGEVDLKRATEITANAMNAFGIQGKDAAHIADVFASAANSSAADVSELGISLSQVAAVAATVGLSFDDTIAALALFADKGLKGSDAGTSLKTSLLSLQPTTEKQKDLFKSLGLFTDESAGKLVNMGGKVLDTATLLERLSRGTDAMKKAWAKSGVVLDQTNGVFRDTQGNILSVDVAQQKLSSTAGISTAKWQSLGLEVSRGGNAFFDATGKLKPLIQIQEELQKATAGMTQQQKLATLEQIGGTDAVRALAIITDTSKEKLLEYNKALGVQGSAQETAKRRMDNLSGSLEQLKGSLETAIITIGNLGTGPIRSVIDFLTKLVNLFISLPDSAKQIIILFLLLVGSLTGLAGGFLLAGGFVLKLIKTFKELKLALQVIRDLELVTKGLQALNASFLTNPVFLIIAAIVALGVALFIAYKKSKAFRDFVDTLWQGIQKAFDAIVNAGEKVVNFFKGHWNQVLAVLFPFLGFPLLIIRHWSEIVSFFSSLPGKVGGALASLGSTVGTAILNVIQSIPGFIANIATQAFQLGIQFVAAVVKGLLGLPGAFLNAVGYAIGFLVGLQVRIIASAIELGVGFVTGLIGVLISLPDRMAEIFLRVVTATASWVIDMLGRAVDLGARFLTGLLDFFSQLPGRIWEFLTATSSNVASWVVDMAGRAVDAGARFLNGLLDWLQNLPGRVAEILGNTMSNVFSFVGAFASEAWDAGRQFFDNIWNGIQGLPGMVEGLLGRVIDAFLGLIRRAYNAAKNFASSLWNGFKDALFGSPHTKIEYAVWDMVDNVSKSIDDLKTQMNRMKSVMKTSFTQGLTRQLDEAKRLMNEQGLDPTLIDRSLAAKKINISMLGTPTPAVSTTGDTINVDVHTGADAQEIAAEIMWSKRVR